MAQFPLSDDDRQELARSELPSTLSLDNDGDTGQNACCHDGLLNNVWGATTMFDSMQCSGGPF